MPTQSLRPKQAQPNARQQLKVQQLLIPEIERLQQQELQAQRKLGINKQINQIPKTQTKPTTKPSRLEAPYKKSTAKPSQQVEQKRSKADLKKQKEEMLHWLNTVKIG